MIKSPLGFILTLHWKIFFPIKVIFQFVKMCPAEIEDGTHLSIIFSVGKNLFIVIK